MHLFDFHIHSHFSEDSRMDTRTILRVAKKRGLSGVAITDHNTVKGGLVAKQENSNNNFTVIVGSEIRTDVVEIIGLFLNKTILSTDPHQVIDEIRSQGGITVLPHPFRSFIIPHRNQGLQRGISEEIMQRIQLIEVFNARTRVKDNQKARDLASKLKKPMVTGSDAHFYQEVGQVRTSVAPYTNEEELRKNLVKGKTIIELKSDCFLKAIPFILLSGIYSRQRRLY